MRPLGAALILSFALAACGPSGQISQGSGTSGSGGSAAGGSSSSAGASSGTSAGSSSGTSDRSFGGSNGSTAFGGSVTSGGSTSAGASSGGSSGSSNGTAGTTGLWVTGYYTGWDSAGYPVSAVDFGALTHLVVGPVLPNTDGSLDTTFSLGNAGAAWATSAVQAAHAASDRALLWVGGSGSESGFLGATSSANLSTFVANLQAAMSHFGADGVDLDWEPLPSSDEPSFTSLLQALRAAVPGAIVTLPVGTLNMNTDSVDGFYAQAAALADQLNVMSYGMAGAWQGWQSWHSSPISGEGPTTPESIDTTVPAYLAAGVPAAKLGLGVGFFGLCYTPPVTGPKQALGGSTVAASDGTMSYANIVADYAPSMTYAFDPKAQVPYLSAASPVGPAGCSYVSYDDESSIAAKAQYAKANGLGGAIIWELAEGYVPGGPDGGNALLESLRRSFRE
ncbi:MAG: glycosyl hydrolase family 18 protein [Myxococcales bacterium]